MNDESEQNKIPIEVNEGDTAELASQDETCGPNKLAMKAPVIKTVPITSINIGDWNVGDTTDIEESIKNLRTILHPPAVVEGPHGYEPVTGKGRITAAVKVGLTEITVMVVDYQGPLRMLATIDENRARKNRSVLELAEQTKLHKDVYEELNPNAVTKAGRPANGEERVASYAQYMAEMTGKSDRFFQQEIQIAEIHQEVRDYIRDTELAYIRTVLLDIAKAEGKDAQRNLAETLLEKRTANGEGNSQPAETNTKRKTKTKASDTVELTQGESSVKSGTSTSLATVTIFDEPATGTTGTVPETNSPILQMHEVQVEPSRPGGATPIPTAAALVPKTATLTSSAEIQAPVYGQYNVIVARLSRDSRQSLASCSLQLQQNAHQDCLVFLWTDDLVEAVSLIKECGLHYLTTLTWAHGTQQLSRTEICIIAVRGRPDHTLNEESFALFDDPVDGNTLPEVFYALIDGDCDGEKVDLTVKKQRKGWGKPVKAA